jgi:DNA polymerase-1
LKTYTHRVNGTAVPIYYPETLDDLKGFHAFLAKPGVIALDTETTGLRIFSRDFKCRLVQFGRANEAWVLRADLFSGAIQAVLSWPEFKFACHNAPFDLLVLDRCGLADLQDLGSRTFDTYILAHLCDPRTEHDGGAGLGLKPLSAIYVDNDAADTSKALYEVFRREYKATKATGWALIDIDHPLYVTYAGLDVIYTARLLAELSQLIRTNGLSDLAKLEHRVQLITTAQQKRGLLVDVDYTERLMKDLETEATDYAAHAAVYGVDNINSTKQVIEALQGMGEEWKDKTATGNPAVGKEVLLPMADLDKDWNRMGNREPNALADAIVRSKRAAKWGESYVRTFLDDRDESDRIHPFIKSLAARTARMSISNPPLQQLPSSDWTIRRCVVADPGQLIIAADYSAVEMRVLAALAGVQEMRRLISEGADLHAETAKLVYGPEWDQADAKARKRMRGLMKVVGFGKVYGGGAAGLAKQSGLPYDAVKGAVDGYDAVYPEIARYGRMLQRQAASGGGAVFTPIGRRLPLDRERAYAATNYVVQSTARDALAMALIRIEDAGLGEHILLPVHDELVCQFPEADADEGIREIGRLMETEIEGVHIASEPEVYGRSWGNGYGCKPNKQGVCETKGAHPLKWGVEHEGLALAA